MTQVGSVTFTGKSGEHYRFDVWPVETRFKALAAVYFVTKRTYENATYRRASHESIYIGQTASLADPLGTGAQLTCFTKHGANCICIHLHPSEERRQAVEQDLLALHNPTCNG